MYDCGIFFELIISNLNTGYKTIIYDYIKYTEINDNF